MNPIRESDGGIQDDRFARLIELGSTLLSELDLEAVLQAVVEAAQELTGARYAALGVLDPERAELERFIYRGIDEETRRQIGNLPRGRGVLGELIREPTPLRLRDVNEHPHAYGYPLGHPQMRSFLGVPVRVREETFGNLYLTEKEGADEFDESDEKAVRTLAIWAGVAIENARLYTSLAEREVEVQQALRRAETSVDIARTVGGETDVERVLDLIVKRARRLQRFLSQPFVVTEAFTGTPGRSVPRTETLAGCRAILDGETDDWAESSLYMVGDLDEAEAREAKATAKPVAAAA